MVAASIGKNVAVLEGVFGDLAFGNSLLCLRIRAWNVIVGRPGDQGGEKKQQGNSQAFHRQKLYIVYFVSHLQKVGGPPAPA